LKEKINKIIHRIKTFFSFIKGAIVFVLKSIKIYNKGFSLYDLLKLYFEGILKSSLTNRAASISFSFVKSLFPFLLFMLNLIPFIPVENFDSKFLNFLESILPTETHTFFTGIFQDIRSKPRAGLLSSTLLLSIFFASNGVGAIFSAFGRSYHVKKTRNFFKQRLYSIIVAIFLAIIFLFSVICFLYLEIYIQQHIENISYWLKTGRIIFFVLLSYMLIATLYYFGTLKGYKIHFFTMGTLITTLLLIGTTYLFGIYIDNFSSYNKLYGSIGALLIIMLYIWINSIVLLLGFELNISLNKLRKKY